MSIRIKTFNKQTLHSQQFQLINNQIKLFPKNKKNLMYQKIPFSRILYNNNFKLNKNNKLQTRTQNPKT